MLLKAIELSSRLRTFRFPCAGVAELADALDSKSKVYLGTDTAVAVQRWKSPRGHWPRQPKSRRSRQEVCLSTNSRPRCKEALCFPHIRMPPSPKQLALLSYLGQPVSEKLSNNEASELIDAIIGDNRDNHRDWNDDKLILFPDIFADEIASLKKGCFAEYKWFRAEGPASPDLPKLCWEQATRIFCVPRCL
jgi:hypothetical protein